MTSPGGFEGGDEGLRFGVSIKGVVFAPSGECVLLLNDRETWELPGGRIEIGESPMECLEREIREELGLRVRVGNPIDAYLFEVLPERHVFIVTYWCGVLGAFAPRLSAEHRRMGLFPADALPDQIPEGYRVSIVRAWRERCAVEPSPAAAQGSGSSADDDGMGEAAMPKAIGP